MLSNFDIENIADKLDLPIIGVFNKDTLPREREIGSYFINMENSDAGDGTHWVYCKIFCDDERNGKNNNNNLVCRALYFDSFGVDMPKEIEEFLRPFKPIPFNNRQIQNINGTQCGWYCLCCDWVLEHNQHSNSYIDDYNKFLNFWSDDKTKNLKILKEILSKSPKKFEYLNPEVEN
jgi:hypothetical protein